MEWTHNSVQSACGHPEERREMLMIGCRVAAAVEEEISTDGRQLPTCLHGSASFSVTLSLCLIITQREDFRKRHVAASGGDGDKTMRRRRREKSFYDRYTLNRINGLL